MSPLMLMALISLVPFPIVVVAALAGHHNNPRQQNVSTLK
jgi:hypothetical protein